MGVRNETPPAGASFEFSAANQLVAGTGYFTDVGNQLGHSYDVARDRRFLRIKVSKEDAVADVPPDVVVVVNFFEELRRKAPAR